MNKYRVLSINAIGSLYEASKIYYIKSPSPSFSLNSKTFKMSFEKTRLIIKKKTQKREHKILLYKLLFNKIRNKFSYCKKNKEEIHRAKI